MIARRVVLLISPVLVGVGLLTALTNHTRISCTDYCTASEYAYIQIENNGYQTRAYLGLLLGVTGLVPLIILLPSMRLRVVSVIGGLLAALASGFLALPSQSLPYSTVAGFPFIYLIRGCIEAPLSYCPSGAYSSFDQLLFLCDILVLVTFGVMIPWLYYARRFAMSHSGVPGLESQILDGSETIR